MNAVEAVERWVSRVVVGMDLCPFARKPLEQGSIRFVESRASDEADLLAELLHEMELLDVADPEADTTIIVVPTLLADFDRFLDAIGLCEALIEQLDKSGVFQLAHFHPDYVFAGSDLHDAANHTNRSPYPAIHILRWVQVRQAMQTHADIGRIPARNQALLRGLGTDQIPKLTGAAPTDFRAKLAPFKCWDRHTHALFEQHNEAKEDCILQNREEVIGLLEFIEKHKIKSYLEIGIWTGGLVRALHQICDFDRIATADQGYAKTHGFEITLPQNVQSFWGNSDSPEYREWRADLGHIDLVMIDGDHRYMGVKKDFEINRQFPHRFLAFHDITGANRWTTGVAKFWNELEEGHKWEICRPHAEIGLDHSIMGIGVWSEVLP